MRCFTFLFLVSAVSAFMVERKGFTSLTKLDMVSRRDAIGTFAAAAGLVVAPQVSNSFSQQLEDPNYVEQSQMATDGKIDLNNAFVTEYMQFRGMYPHAAGAIASNGPYSKVKDIYNLPVGQREKELFRKYEANFTVRPPGRTFYERINGRVST